MDKTWHSHTDREKHYARNMVSTKGFRKIEEPFEIVVYGQFENITKRSTVFKLSPE